MAKTKAEAPANPEASPGTTITETPETVKPTGHVFTTLRNKWICQKCFLPRLGNEGKSCPGDV